ncbi:MAG TPA: hypothetical protein DCL21_00185, partial [Alphaproteobacteria bacterium]|nr:hypothetical protein [Alphaproteobacteria bacterium]
YFLTFFNKKTRNKIMKNNNLFNYIYSIEELIVFFAKNNNSTYYLDTKTGVINLDNKSSDNNGIFAFKPVTKEYALEKIKFDSSKTLEDILNSNHQDKRIVYNFIKTEVISFLSQNKLLPPSLNPILSFNENNQNDKIVIEIK